MNAHPVPRGRLAFWGVAYAFLALLAFSTAPSPLYVLYAHRDHFSSLTITLIYAAYAFGVVVSLCFASHLSDVHGRRPHLLAAVVLAVAAACLFIAWPALPGLFAARVLSGISVGLTVSTATAYLDELHRCRRSRAVGAPAQLTSTVANLGGLSLGALLTGVLAQYVGHPLVVPYVVLLAMLALAGVAVALSPETRSRRRPLPAYRPQRPSAPEHARRRFYGALIGVLLAYAGPAVFIGLAGTFLATAVHDTSLATAGATVAVLFLVGIAVLSATRTWPARRLIVAGSAADIAGLGIVVGAAWLPTPSLALFLAGGGIVGAGTAALFKGTLGTVVDISPRAQLGEALAGFFLSGYVGLSVPAIAVGIALQFIGERVALLAFAIAVGAGILCAAPLLLGSPDAAGPRGRPIKRPG